MSFQDDGLPEGGMGMNLCYVELQVLVKVKNNFENRKNKNSEKIQLNAH